MPLSSRFVLVLLAVILIGCSVEKRLYNKGFHIEWHHRIHTVEHRPSITPTINETIRFGETDTVLAVAAVDTDLDYLAGQHPNLPDSVTPRPEENRHSALQIKSFVADHQYTEGKSGDVKKTTDFRPWSRESKNASMIFVGILALLLLIAVIAILLHLQTATLALQASVLLIIVSAFLLILLVVSLLSLIVMAAIDSQEQLANKQPRQSREEEEWRNKTPEEQADFEREKRHRNTEKGIAVGLIIVVALLVLLVAL